MANFTLRTIDEVFQEMLLEKQNLTALNDLIDGGITDETTLITELYNSDVAEWVLWIYNQAVQTHIEEISIASAVTDIQDIFDTQKIPTINWYIEEVLKFQYGDNYTLNPITYVPYYETVDTSKQIISSCTLTIVGNKLVFKVRRKDTDILSSAELTAFESYIDKFKSAGARTQVNNYVADKFIFNMTILYDGTYDLAAFTATVEAAINNYLDNIEFDGTFLTSKMIDALQNLDGMIDPRLDSASGEDSVSTAVSFTHEYTCEAGYGQIDSASPLSSTITYVGR